MPETDEPEQNGCDHADRDANGELIGQCIGNVGAYERNASGHCAGNSDYAAQQPSRKECTEQIEGRRTARGAAAKTDGSEKKEGALKVRTFRQS